MSMLDKAKVAAKQAADSAKQTMDTAKQDVSKGGVKALLTPKYIIIAAVALVVVIGGFALIFGGGGGSGSGLVGRWRTPNGEMTIEFFRNGTYEFSVTGTYADRTETGRWRSAPHPFVDEWREVTFYDRNNVESPWALRNITGRYELNRNVLHAAYPGGSWANQRWERVR